MKKINIIGCGSMGSQIACLFNIMGYEVSVWNRKLINLDKLEKQKKILNRILKFEDKKGKFQIIKDINNLKNSITIECISEDKELKKQKFLEIANLVNKEIFTNTSSIKTNEIEKNLNLLHFFNPISMKIIEHTKFNILSEEAKNLFEDLKKNNFNLIEVSNYTGYAFNKLLFNQISNFFFLIEKENLKKNQALIILKHLNRDFDILNVIDIIGTDICKKILENLNNEYGTYVPRIFELCETKHVLGKKNKTTVKNIFDSVDYPEIT